MAGTDQWRRVDQLFHEALALPAGDRPAFLDVACAGDETLRHELETLLASDEPSFFEKSAVSAAARYVTPAIESWTGRTLGSYEIVELLGAGGMGEVYRARDTSLGREVALKLLPPDLSADPELVRRLEREARILASLNHPRIATLYGLENDGGQRFLAIELVEGQTLAERLHQGRVPQDEALSICRQITEGLEAAHEAGIVHRDLKPGNVKITPDGSVKLLDFGLAKVVERPAAAAAQPLTAVESTREGSILGTPAYMSPEQARGQVVDRRCDIWAFGCCLYECLSGRRAFSGETVTDTLAAVLDKEPEWSVIGDDVPAAVRRLLRRCLEKDVRRRLQHIGDARLELEETAAEPLAAPSRRSGYAWLFLAGLALLLSIGAWIGASMTWRRVPSATDHRVTRLTLKWDDQPADSPALQVHRFFIPFAISPGGERIVLKAGWGTRASPLYLRELSGFDVTPLAGTNAATSPFFSPDGRWIGFWRGEDRLLYKVSIGGGAPIGIASTEAVFAALWLPNDEIVIDTARTNEELWSIPPGGGTPRPIVVRDRVADEHIALRATVPGGPDLIVASISPGGTWLDVLSRETGRRRRLLRGGSNEVARYTGSGHLVFSDGDALYAVTLDQRSEPLGNPVPVLQGIDRYLSHSNVAISDNGTVAYVPAERVRESGLFWLDRTARVTAIAGGQGAFANAALSPDGREAAAGLVDGTNRQVWILDLERGTRRLLSADTRAGNPIWSSDGSTITYVSYRSDGMTLCRKRADGTGPEESLVRPTGRPEPKDWSPDGRSLLFSEYTGRGDADIWIYSNGESRPLIATKFSETDARFSPDVRFVAFAADDGGVSQVYVQPFPGPGPRTTISTKEGSDPRWSVDGRHLYYLEGRHLMVVDVQTKPSLLVGKSSVVLEGQPPWALAGIAPGAARFLVFRPRAMEGPPELRLVINWFEELERLAPHSQQ